MTRLPPPTLPPIARVLRALRATLHLVEGLATTSLVFPFVAPRTRRALIRRWSARLLRQLAIETRVRGALDGERSNLLIVANHVSWLDIFVLNAHQPARFVAKAEIARWPVAGRLVRGVGTIFVERERRHDTRRVNHRAAHALASGDVVAVFPEGRTTDGTTVARFHASLLQPVVDARGQVLPVALRYRDDDEAPTLAAAYVGEDTFVDAFWRVCGQRRIVVDVHVGEPLRAEERHRRELAHAAERAIRTALDLPASATEPGTPVDRRA